MPKPKKSKVVAKVIRSSRTGTRRPGGSRAPYEPSVRDMEMFYAYTSGQNVCYADIGKAYHVSRARVGYIFKRVKNWLIPRYAEDIRGIKVEQTESLLHIFKEAMAAWERSKMNAESVTVKDIEYGEEKIPAVEKTTTTKGQCGDPRFLAEARGALDDIREIWGANAPVKIEHSGELRVAGMSVEEANRQLVEQIEQVKGRLLLSSVN
jgi:hypothetical protein